MDSLSLVIHGVFFLLEAIFLPSRKIAIGEKLGENEAESFFYIKGNVEERLGGGKVYNIPVLKKYTLQGELDALNQLILLLGIDLTFDRICLPNRKRKLKG